MVFKFNYAIEWYKGYNGDSSQSTSAMAFVERLKNEIK